MFAILNHTCILSTWSVLSNNEIWTQSSCKRVSKSKSHPGMKLAPVRVFRTPLNFEHPVCYRLWWHIFFFFFFFIMKRHLEEIFFWGGGGERDDVDERTSVSSIIYSKEIDTWIINWPTDTASPIFSCPLNATCFWNNLWQLKGLCHGSPVHFV